MILRVKLRDPRTVQGHRMHPASLKDEVVANLPPHIHIDSESMSVDDVDWCPGGRVWEIVPNDVADVSANDPNCVGLIKRGNFICEHMIEIGD